MAGRRAERPACGRGGRAGLPAACRPSGPARADRRAGIQAVARARALAARLGLACVLPARRLTRPRRGGGSPGTPPACASAAAYARRAVAPAGVRPPAAVASRAIRRPARAPAAAAGAPRAAPRGRLPGANYARRPGRSERGRAGRGGRVAVRRGGPGAPGGLGGPYGVRGETGLRRSRPRLGRASRPGTENTISSARPGARYPRRGRVAQPRPAAAAARSSGRGSSAAGGCPARRTARPPSSGRRAGARPPGRRASWPSSRPDAAPSPDQQRTTRPGRPGWSASPPAGRPG